tara:strand:+ start:1398 stop:1742 length:345 start_codon:yes stop_codon:yes gene_type:complete
MMCAAKFAPITPDHIIRELNSRTESPVTTQNATKIKNMLPDTPEPFPLSHTGDETSIWNTTGSIPSMTYSEAIDILLADWDEDEFSWSKSTQKSDQMGDVSNMFEPYPYPDPLE